MMSGVKPDFIDNVPSFHPAINSNRFHTCCSKRFFLSSFLSGVKPDSIDNVLNRYPAINSNRFHTCCKMISPVAQSNKI